MVSLGFGINPKNSKQPKMKEFIPQALLSTIPNLYDTQDQENPLCHVKLFTPDGNWTWFIIELFKDDMDTCYGYVQGLENELGYFSLKEIGGVRGLFGLAVEYDTAFTPTPLSLLLPKRTHP